MPFWSGIKFSTSALEFTIKKKTQKNGGPVMILSVECRSISTSISEIRLTQGVIRYEGVSQLYVG